MLDVDADYYGYRDDDDGILLPLEKEAEREGYYGYRDDDDGILLPLEKEAEREGWWID
ncbi:unnamed protein product [Plutella xylostella]|uniref:(diamondback moth) hypothetical protein n=1 Tax=Plutella xylostella TaxID=51655 RepID=A0A8S4EJI2_PLUXY|nr:unnamed protein product [Plutella xylostella]